MYANFCSWAQFNFVKVSMDFSLVYDLAVHLNLVLASGMEAGLRFLIWVQCSDKKVSFDVVCFRDIGGLISDLIVHSDSDIEVDLDLFFLDDMDVKFGFSSNIIT